MTSSPVVIPSQFQADGFRFVKLGRSDQWRKIPVEYFWECLTLQEAKMKYAEELAAANGDRSSSKKLRAGEPERITNYGFDDPILLQHLSEGLNYGVINGTGPDEVGLATLDADNLPRLAELVDLSRLPLTLEVGRRGEGGEPIPDRRHFHFLSDLDGKYLLKDPVTGKDLGDVRGAGGYQVVGPSSLHPSGARVEVLEDRPLAHICGDELLKILAPALEVSKLETDRARLEKITTEAYRRKAARLRSDGTDHPYANAALDYEVSSLRSASVGERNNQLNRSAFALFQLVKGGALDRGEVERELSRAARSAGLMDDEINRTLQSAWSGAGTREIPERDPRCVRAEADTSATDENSRVKENSGQSMATRIVDYALSSGASFWKTSEGEPFATLPNIAGHIENHPLKSKAVKTWLSALLYYAEKKVPKGSVVADALAVLEGRATFEGEIHAVFVRLAEYAGKFYLDLGGEDWSAVEVGPDGWEVIPSEALPVKFRRPKGILELPEPKRGGNLEDLRCVLNVPEGAPWILVRGWLVQALKPTGPYPPLIVDGEQGSGKSWLGRILRYLIDPNKAPLRRPPRNEYELMIAANNSWLNVFDNLSGLPQWFGDALCIIATGGGSSVRELYTNSEETLFDLQRPIILNGIDALTTRGDLLDRAILIHLPRIEAIYRRTEKEIRADLDRIRPGVLGSLLDVISAGLKALPEVKLESMPRMADFAEWVVACESALGLEAGEFLTAFEEKQNESKIALIENDMFAVSLVEFINGSDEPFEGTAGFLLSVLEEQSHITVHNRPDGWPRTAKGAGNKLRRIIPALQALGIEVSFRDGHGHVRLIEIKRLIATNPDSNATTATQKSASEGGGGDGGVHLLPYTPKEKEREEGSGVKREEENNRKQPPLPLPQPQDSVFSGGDGGGGKLLGGGEEPNGPDSEDTGRVFGLSLAYYSDLAFRNSGLTVGTLAEDMGWPRDKAKMALEMLKSPHDWVHTDAQGYVPPTIEVVA